MKLNLPTKITVARMALIPLVLVMYYLIDVSEHFILAMTFVYMIASMTDALDGHIARSRNMVTTLGKFLDPIADKVLVVTGLFIIVDSGILSWGSLGMIGSVIIMARELAISAFRQIAATKGVVMAADKWGKAKTMCTLIAIPDLFLGMYRISDDRIVQMIGEVFFWIGAVMFAISVVLTIISGINYILKNKEVLKESTDESNEEVAVVLDEQNEDTNTQDETKLEDKTESENIDK